MNLIGSQIIYNENEEENKEKEREKNVIYLL